MNFLIINMYAYGGSILEKDLDDVLKEIPFGVKTSIKKQKYEYTYILVPVQDSVLESDNFKIFSNTLYLNENLSKNEKYSIYKCFEDRGKVGVLLNNKITFDFIGRTSDSEISIFYTDGSFKKATSECSYACIKLLNEVLAENVDEAAAMDDFTGKMFTYNASSGIIKDGTNNVGELSAFKEAVSNFSEKTYQLVIADSEYSVKIFREYIYNWKNNGFRTYSGKPIANKELITEIYNEMVNKNKIVFFKWTKGHDQNSFNEICDREAKDILGIK